MSEQGVADASLWISHLTHFSGMSWLTRRLGKPQLGPYLFVFWLLFLDLGVLTTIRYFAADIGHPLLANPFLFLAPVGLWFSIWIIRRLASSQHHILDQYDLEEHFRTTVSDSSMFYDIRQNRIKHLIYPVLLGIHLSNFVIFGRLEGFVEFWGPIIAFIKFGILVPFGYFPIIAEFASLILASLLIVPRYFIRHRYQLQFDDPLDVGGLAPIGELMKLSFYSYNLGIVILIVWTYGPFIFTQFTFIELPPPRINEILQLILAWFLGLFLLIYGGYTFHRYMQKGKQQKLIEIDNQIRALGNDNRSIPETVPDEDTISQLEYEYLRMEKVRNLRTLPFTIAAQEQLLLSALFPILLERLIFILLL